MRENIRKGVRKGSGCCWLIYSRYFISRPLRIQYPDAWYHVMNRGRQSDEIFREDKDYVAFIDIPKKIVEDNNLKLSTS